MAAVAKKLHDGHADQHVVIKDEHGSTVGRLAVPVERLHADNALSTSDRGVVTRNRQGGAWFPALTLDTARRR
jgi:hypothetical protein